MMLGYKNLGQSPKTYYGFTYPPGEIHYEAPGYINDPEFLYCGTEEDPRDFSQYPRFETVSSFLSIETVSELSLIFAVTLVKGNLIIYFGDGESETVFGPGLHKVSHTYADGEYTVEFTPYVNTLWSPGGHDETSDKDISIISTSNSSAMPNDLSVVSFTSKGDVSAFGACAFGYITTLETVEVPASVTSINDAAFVSCAALEHIDVSVKNAQYASIEGVLFNKDLDRLRIYPAAHGTSYSVPAGTLSIHATAFDNALTLETVIFPSSLTAMGANAFRGCSNLSSMTVNAVTPPSIDATTFTDVPADSVISVPADSVDTYKAASVWSDRAEYIQAISG